MVQAAKPEVIATLKISTIVLTGWRVDDGPILMLYRRDMALTSSEELRLLLLGNVKKRQERQPRVDTQICEISSRRGLCRHMI